MTLGPTDRNVDLASRELKKGVARASKCLLELAAMAPTTTPFTDIQSKVLDLLERAQAPAAEYVGMAARALADRLPEDRPELLTQGIDTLVGQVDFAKKVIDAQVDLVKTILDAAVQPVRPVPVRKSTVKAA